MCCLVSCEETQEATQQEFSASLDSLAWPPNNYPTGNRIQLSLSEDFESLVYGTENDLSAETARIAAMWDAAVPNVPFFGPAVNIVPNLEYKNLESYWDPKDRTQIGIYHSDQWFEDVPSGAIAITQFYAVQDFYNGKAYYKLIHADIIFNSRDHSFSMDESDRLEYHFPSVLMHELGHLLGLDHTFQMSSGSIMIPSFGPNYFQDSLASIDEKNILKKYQFFETSLNNLNFSKGSGRPSNFKQGQVKRFIRYLKKNGNCKLHVHNHH